MIPNTIKIKKSENCLEDIVKKARCLFYTFFWFQGHKSGECCSIVIVEGGEKNESNKCKSGN